MILQIESDWHLEMHRDAGRGFVEALDPTGVDVLVLAGDILVAKFWQITDYILSMIAAKYENAEIVYVPGNHEFWGTVPEETWNLLRAVQQRLPNLHILRNEAVILGGKKFIGGTMWFPRGEPDYGRNLEELMPDFELIQGFRSWVYLEHQRFVDALAHDLSKGDVVVTHHTPSPLSIPARFMRAAINKFFMANQEAFMLEREPALWVHGHTHDVFDYQIKNTRVVCNPCGYPHERKRSGYGRKIVEI